MTKTKNLTRTNRVRGRMRHVIAILRVGGIPLKIRWPQHRHVMWFSPQCEHYSHRKAG